MELINDGDTVAIVSGGMVGYPEYLSIGLAERYKETGHPKGLTVFAGCGHGIPVHPTMGDSKFAQPGMLKRYVASHPMTCRPIQEMIMACEVEGYSLPQGVLQQLYRTSAAKQPGLLTKIGMGTYIDPRQDGGKMSAAAKEDIVRLMEIDGEEWLFYKAHPINAAFIRVTTGDEDGNLTIEEEALKLEIMETALAAKARGGKVIAQVKRVAAKGTLKAKDVAVPGEIVDAVVIADKPEETHRQTLGQVHNPYYSGELRRPAASAPPPKDVLTPDDVVCRRALYELRPGAIVNVGVGVGAGIGLVAETENVADKITFTLELGTFGGVPTPPSDFGASLNASSFVAHPTMFDFYHGGGLDIAFLGAAEVDKVGNVNVSLMSGRPSGQGGFMDISQCSKKTVFVMFFTASGFKGSVKDGKMVIDQEGGISKIVDKVAQITYSGQLAMADGREAVFVTERAVFKLTKEGLLLTEIAPGMDLERDVLGKMGFKPIVSKDLKLMDARIFTPGRMGCFD
jgi:propionate CoA-transferase